MALSLWLCAQLCRTHCQLSISNWKVSFWSLTVWSCDRPKSDGILKPMFWIQNSCIEGQKLIFILKEYQIFFFDRFDCWNQWRTYFGTSSSCYLWFIECWYQMGLFEGFCMCCSLFINGWRSPRWKLPEWSLCVS